jgi:hypothetical protein
MSEKQPPSDPTRGAGGTWFSDSWFVVGFSLWFASVLITLAPVLSFENRSAFSDLWADFVTLPFTIGLAALNARRTPSPRERKFWWFFVAALSCWLAVRVIYVIAPAEEWLVGQDVLTDSLYGVFYLMLALALEMKPHSDTLRREPIRRSIRRRDDRIPVSTIVVFFVATLVYFIIIPARQDPDTYRYWIYSFALYVVLDLYLCGRLFSILHGVSGDWSRVYRWLLATFVMWTITDAAEGGLYADVLPWIEPGTLFDFVWFVPSLVIIIALRSRWWGGPEVASR